MIYSIKEYGITCDKCRSLLCFSMKEKVLTAYRGHAIKEDSSENIKKVARKKGWSIKEQHLCKKCKK
jgi:hypothetical protein